MKKILYFFLLIGILASCDKSEPNNILPNTPVNYIVNMNLPQYSDLQIAGVAKETPDNIGIQGIIIYNFNGSYKAFDLACPHKPVRSCDKMEFDGSLFLKCPCDDAKFSIYDGSPQSSDVVDFAREYHVQEMGGNQLRITNY